MNDEITALGFVQLVGEGGDVPRTPTHRRRTLLLCQQSVPHTPAPRILMTRKAIDELKHG